MTTQKPQKQRRYYDVAEQVFIKPLNKVGTIVNLRIEPKTETTSGTYEADISYYGDYGLVIETFNLWQLDKVKENKASKKENKFEKRERDVVYFAKVRPTAKIPSKRLEDAGYDIYCDFPEEMMVIQPHEIKLVPTGIASAMSSKYYLNFKHERGSTAKIGLMTAAGVVDSGYRNEIFLALYNPTGKAIAITKEVTETTVTEDFVLYPYTKAVAQATLDLVSKVDVKEISYEQLKEIPSVRGTGALGSSGK